MAHLAEHYRPLALEALVRGLGTGSLPDRAVAVTLDDGYLDALDRASPILIDLGVPATFFCTTARLEEEHELWWDTLERVLLDGSGRSDSLALRLAGTPRTFGTGTLDARRQALAALGEALRTATLEERDDALAALARWHGGPLAARATHRALTGAEIQRLARRPGHAVGAHSSNHLALPPQTPKVRAREVAGCRRRLELLLQREVAAFAYPYGAYDDATVEAVRAAGFEAALTVEEGLSHAGGDPLRLPRVEVRSSGVDAFAVRLARLFASDRNRVLAT
jgi:peptidoglycan/xylan/chitin deacetylase (PgdA/CDA1 family)